MGRGGEAGLGSVCMNEPWEEGQGVGIDWEGGRGRSYEVCRTGPRGGGGGKEGVEVG